MTDIRIWWDHTKLSLFTACFLGVEVVIWVGVLALAALAWCLNR